MKNEILNIIANYHSVHHNQVKRLYKKHKSFDKVILTIEICQSNCINIDDIIKYM